MPCSDDKRLKITDLPEADRPREKLLLMGAESLSDAELLAILIGSGNTTETAVTLMQRIMKDCKNNLNLLGKLSVHDLQVYKGIGMAKAVTIVAACELGKRRQRAEIIVREKFNSSASIYEYMHSKMQDFQTEEAWIMLLDQAFSLIEAKRISYGGLTEMAVDVRIILKEALLKNATVIALAHNHPSNRAYPSPADDELTQKLHEACQCMRIHFLDHIIVTDGTYYSYSDEGLL